LATITAHAATQHGNTPTIADTARRRLVSLTDGEHVLHRASRESSPLISRARAALPTLTQRAHEAADALTRLESQVPADSVEETPSVVIRALLVAGLLAESLILYASLGATALGDSPAILLVSSLTLAPMAAALLSRAGVVIRRGLWQRRIAWTDGVLVVLSLCVAFALGIGLTLSRVGELTIGRHAALLTSAGLQAVILILPLVDGYLHASPVPGLRSARRSRDRAVGAHDAHAAELARLEAEHLEREVELFANAESSLAEFDSTLARLAGHSAPPQAERTGTVYRGLTTGSAT